MSHAGKAVKVTIYVSEGSEGKAKLMRIRVDGEDKWKNKPLHQALVEPMRANDFAGVTVYRGASRVIAAIGVPAATSRYSCRAINPSCLP